ncbi:trafficking protein particle complex subunit 10-like [Biomphalaria glabrata]|uniref:Trafficking protein particle complex subunit 10-like n=1 Tax=Biomphalaria glabrata TaxID=6526 RepID=A0A9W3AS58_BIOGL|nr:trafficking protein particle complex subunit 10-like [Biomphalaria glabrata]
MNEAKPIVTCHGNKALFSSLNQLVSQGLPKESCEWRRSYGRPPRAVNLDASFVPYDADILPDEEEKTLVSRPYFHIYWTDCDLDTYKQSVRDDINEWLGALRTRNIPDWLIVVVTNEESKVKAKLLARTSVIDKVKSDFCSKYPERCITLIEPNKLDSKSSESWSQLFQRLRSLLLQAFNRHLNKYEENMRSRREKRNEPGWNYFSYFICQEELAFMLEMLGLKEDALIQYDELDATFDQFIENFANGDTVKWLTHLMKPCTCWAGVSLSKALDLELREEVKQNNASLLEFRNYLFSRQAALLFQMGRTWEVAMRAMDYLYNTVVEMKALEVEAPTGAVGCWGFLSCLEVLRACNDNNTTQLDEKFALYTANLWDFAHKKLRELGQMCSLMPGMSPSSQQLSLVVDLVAGMGLSMQNLSHSGQTPVDKLRESLSSTESFKKHYLELCEQAMGTYKYIGRFRSARMIGLELADFYMKIKDPTRAENFLLDSIKMYQQESWHHLADGTMLQLAECQKLLEEPDRYLKTSCHIACSPNLSLNDRHRYFQELMLTLQKITGHRTEMRASQAIYLEELQFSSLSVNLNDDLALVVVLTSNFPEPITFDKIQVNIKKCSISEALEFVDKQQQQHHHPQQKQVSHRRQPSGTHILVDKMLNFQPVTKTLPSKLDFHTVVERSKGRLVSCSIGCDSAHQLLKRLDSAGSNHSTAEVHKEDYAISFSLASVTLSPGANTLSFTTQIHEKGIFHLSQMCFSVQSLDLLKPISAEGTSFKVNSLSPEFSLKPKHSDIFIAGIKQEGILTCTSGSYSLKVPSPLTFSATPHFTITGDGGSTDVILGAMEAGFSQDIPVQVYMSLKNNLAHHLQSKVNVGVTEWDRSYSKQTDFVHPFNPTHRMFTNRKDKYFQLVIHSSTSVDLCLSNPVLEAPGCPDVHLILINRAEQILPVNENQSLTLLWHVVINTPEISVLDLTFSCDYSCDLDVDHLTRRYECMCHISDFQTQFVLTYNISSIEEDKCCTTGETAIMDIKIKQVKEMILNEGVKLAYSVHANGTVWALGGKSSGVFTLKDGKYNTVLDVVPMQPGFLHFPLVTLHRYVDQQDDHVTVDHVTIVDSDTNIPLASSEKPKRTVSQLSTSSFMSHLADFGPGQVYNESRSKQIHVYPCHTTSDIDISIIQ